MKSSELRNKFLEFMKEKGHTIIPSSSLVPENDPSVLFTTAGMHPLVPYLMGEKHPAGSRLANIQKCVRTGDIDEVGDATHLTFFEMLGNWSLGDPSAPDGIGQSGYWKKESIEWSFEFLTKELKIPAEKISVTCFAGDENVPRDDESAEIWKSLGIPEERIKFLGKEDNWWGPAGEIGPCGPDTEIFVDLPGQAGSVEIWNNVFLGYNKTANGYEPLKQKNVDTGMGLERTLMILNGQESVFETDLFEGLLKDDSREAKIIADHIKAAVFILSEGVLPSNTGQGYVLRRLIRRSMRYGADFEIANKVISLYKNVYPELEKGKERILDELKKEKEKFEKTLDKGLKEFEKGTDPFVLFTTYGFPIELTQEIAKEKGVEIDLGKFNAEMKKHQELSRTASGGMFKGGLADAGDEAVKYHTATHLLLAGLRKSLGDQVFQKGSNINAERLRFDFSYTEKLTETQIKEVEDFVNDAIASALPVLMEEMTLEEAKAKNAMGVFESKYGEKVKVYTIGGENPVSVEICGGPHVKNTSEIGKIRIVKEEAVAAGIRRIKAVIEK